jgi:hypothetical protein
MAVLLLLLLSCLQACHSPNCTPTSSRPRPPTLGERPVAIITWQQQQQQQQQPESRALIF